MPGQTHARERAIKHWLSGQHGPDTVFILRLVVSSPVIRAFVLGLIEKPAGKGLSAPMDRHSLAAARMAYIVGENAAIVPAGNPAQNDPMDDPDRDPVNDPEPSELNERQHWFLARVEVGDRCRAGEIVGTRQVSLKTARRELLI